MKKLVQICSVTLLFMGGVAFTSCDQSNETIPDAKTQVVNQELQKNAGGGPVANAGPSAASYKLIFENLSTASVVVADIFSKGVNTTPGTTNFVHFKGTSTTTFTVPPGQTVTFNNYVTATTGYAIPQWRIENSTLVQNQDFLDTASNALANYGIQIPQAVVGAKYSYWYGAFVSLTSTSGTYNSYMGNINNNALYLGRASFGNAFDQTILCTGTASDVTLTWEVLSNGDVKVKAIN
jgi:hypothetical protein